jgi:ATP/maltotriose-dependent transcriptional regulator MalT
MLKRGEIATLIGWYRKLPKEIACAQPALCMAFAWALLLASQFDEAEPLLEHAENLAPPASSFLGQVAAAQAYLARARGDDQQLIEKSQQALALLPEGEMISRGNVALNLGIAYWHAGRLEEAERVLLEEKDITGRVGNTYALLAAQIFLARTSATREDSDRPQPCTKNSSGRCKIPILALAHYDLSAIHYEWNHLQPAESICSIRAGVETQREWEFQNSAYPAGFSRRPLRAGAVRQVEQS